MRLVPYHEHEWLADGTVVDGHVVEGVDGQVGVELRYRVTAPDGTAATLLTSPRAFEDRRERSRFRRLAARRAALDHPAAIPVRSVSEVSGHPVFVTDLCPEHTLARLVQPGKRLSPRRIVTMLAPIADALEEAHAAGLVHQALSLDSLLLAGSDELQLDTFGLLRPDADWGVSEDPDARYRSPEQVSGERPDVRSNVYSLAAVLVHALTGEAPYRGDSIAVTYLHLVEAPPTISERVPGLGPRIDAVLRRGMAKDPKERQASPGELVREVAEALGVRSRARPEPEPLPPEPIRTEPVPEEDTGPADETGEPRAPRGSGLIRRPVAIPAAAVVCGVVAALVVTPFAHDEPAAGGRPAHAVVWKRLADARAELRDRLASARTPQAQSEAAAALAEAFGDAARSGGPRALAAAASDADVAYVQLAAAANRGDRAAYVEAGRAVEDAERRVSLAASRN